MTFSHPRAAVLLLLGVLAALVVPVAVAGPAAAATKLTQSQAGAQLSSAGITWSSSGGCTTRSNSTCTSFDQINQETVSGVITFAQASACAVNITGGTEVGHTDGTYSHYNGYKVDISPTTCVSNHITSTYTYSGTRTDGTALYTAPSGNVYARETNHWDITYYSCGC